jgi:hypothetical protein
VGWERRQGSSRRYYSRSRKVHGRVIREYVGGGILGEIAAQRDAQAREARQAARVAAALAFAETRAQHQALDQMLDALDAMCHQMMRDELHRAGYHQHNRGEWRKRRGRKVTETNSAA